MVLYTDRLVSFTDHLIFMETMTAESFDFQCNWSGVKAKISFFSLIWPQNLKLLQKQKFIFIQSSFSNYGF